MYRFDHALRDGPFAHKAAHASELPFVWDHAEPKPRSLAAAIHAAWVSFIKTGRPAAAGLPNWPAFRLPERLTMILDDKSHVESDPNGRERQLWVNRL
jgi:para-nitrobenzyl esterase